MKYKIISLSLVKELSHGMSVSNLAYLVAKELGLSEEDCHDLAVAGFLHDVGKLELGRCFRNEEQETLTVEELKYVRLHPEFGSEILRREGYNERIVSYVLNHHENCDGTGYPQNLHKDEIPFGARILRVCDVFIALTSDRPYRKAFDIETAMELMIDEVKNYDMQVFLALMRVIHEEGIEEILDKGDQESLFEEEEL